MKAIRVPIRVASSNTLFDQPQEEPLNAANESHQSPKPEHIVQTHPLESSECVGRKQMQSETWGIGLASPTNKSEDGECSDNNQQFFYLIVIALC